MNTKILFLCASFAALGAVAANNKAQWDAGMDDDAGKAKETTVSDLPSADFTGQSTAYPIRDRLYTTSLDGTWSFKLLPGLEVPKELEGWNKPGFDTREWDDIAVPGNWETQGFKAPQYGNQIDEMTGLYVRNFRWNYRWEAQRVILRFDGVLFGYEVWVNGEYVGRWGSAYNLAQWDITDKLIKGRNTIAVKVITRSYGWLFDTNDCWAIAGIQRSVELYTVPDDHIKDITLRTLGIDSVAKSASIWVKIESGFSGKGEPKARRAYVSLVDEDGVHALDFDLELNDGVAEGKGTLEKAKLWNVNSPYLYTLVTTLVDERGAKIQRIAEKQGIRMVEIVDKHLEINGETTFMKGVAWNEIDPVEGRAITKETRRTQMILMKKAGVNCIRTAHYPFGPDFLDLCDEMGFYAIDEVPFGSRGSSYLKNRAYKDELIARTEATMRRDKNHASVIFWTFGNENTFTPNTKDVLAYAKIKDPTRPRGLPQIGSSQAKETMYHPERDVDFVAAHYLNPANMAEYEKNTKKALIQTEFAHACGNGFCDFEDRLARMQARPDVWMGGCIWAWIDQSLMHRDDEKEMEEALKLTRIVGNNRDLPKDMRRDMPKEFQGNYVDPLHFIDSWADRATDGVVYGDGTPKDGYWLVKALYAGKLPEAREEIPAPKAVAGGLKVDVTALKNDNAKQFLLRIGRKLGLDQQIQTLGRKNGFRHDKYLVEPEVLALDFPEDGKAVYKLKWLIDEDKDKFIEGTIAVTHDGEGFVFEYNLAPSERCLKNDRFTELGLTFAETGTRVDWVGQGPLTSVPGKSKMNSFGTWSMHKDDYRFIGNRRGVKWAMVSDGASGFGLVLESGTGNVSFENIDGVIYLTENLTVAGYGGKGAGPNSLAETKNIAMKGKLKVYVAPISQNLPCVVPDLTYSYHYGF